MKEEFAFWDVGHILNAFDHDLWLLCYSSGLDRPWATKGFGPPRGNFVDYVFVKA